MSLDKYLSDVNRESMISPEEEVELAVRIREGDEKALEKMVRANLRFVVSVAKQYQNQGINLSDLINEGNLGLIKAARRFDETRGFKFISFAVWWIRQSIMQALADDARIVRIPLNQIGKMNKINRALADLEQKLQRHPTDDEVADLLEMDVSAVQTAPQYANKHMSLDAPLSEYDSESTTFGDMIHSEETADKMMYNQSLRTDIDRTLDTLPDKERNVLRMYYGLDGRTMSLNEIGDKLELTRERVRQIKDRAITRLRGPARRRLLKPHLG
jgi:RNA polymerase primary sigma factor